MLVLAISFVDLELAKRYPAEAKQEIKEEIKEEIAQKIEPVASPEPTREPDDIEGYIRYVFKEDADKALLLLKGKGEGTCAENRRLDPYAKHTNKNGTTDWGLFQINDYWHPVFKLNLHKDWKANTQYAYKMFLRDNKTFKRWSCGKFYGI
jgi:hypothetical protein